MKLNTLTARQQERLFIFEKWVAVWDGTSVYIGGLDSSGEVKPLFKMPKLQANDIPAAPSETP